MKNIVCFGEVLWDVFPTHKKIGGAPLNVASRLKSLENRVCLISKVGNDAAGSEIIDFLNKQGIDTQSIKVDHTLKTGDVKVSLDNQGSATYSIEFPRAWDYIELTPDTINITRTADAFIYGSLAARNHLSKNTLSALLKLAKYKIFDVNLRAPHYTADTLSELMDAANFIKFNDDEILEIAKALDFESESLEENIKFIAKYTNTESICVTRGGKGAILYRNDLFYYNNGYPIVVVDTVGAGDSFLASLINKLLKGTPPQNALDYACAIGAIVASHEGANPKIEKATIDQMIYVQS
ncbi:carbohydrate kinase [Zobellia sp. 1_MG-2023]|uniref:carbohydrate kinase family protein n=1 Tax=Zobellia sp. 1_MG-2023 TaxID=3062626 RepID=UPI0026E2A67C|nr:carbohydrate kinase [Zobellia sp. 1_MG-2023]MDO6818421.1 carbohydrate kinase [Zobellia sp. 1_MG-2023]